jgi:SNF family Na+-dependent transporter
VLGGTIALTAAVVFFGVTESMQIARQGSFDLGFHAMPLVMEQIPGGRIFGAMWFFLLFLAGITSSVAMMQPTVALLREDFGFPRERAVLLTGALLFLCAQPVFFFLGHGFMDQLDFWAGSFALLVFGFLEIVVFAWIFGMTEGWAEITRGARMRIPGVFRFGIQWVMPLGMGAILLAWSATELLPELSLAKVGEADRPYVIGARVLMATVLVGFWLAVWAGARRRAAAGRTQ